MATSMTFAKVQDYLDAILAHSGDDIQASPHKRFWRTMSYTEFTTGVLPGNVKCHGQPIPIVNRNANQGRQSPFYLILQGGFCGKEQMPPGDTPKLGAADYEATLPGGTKVSGQKIIDDLGEWLDNNFPEHGAP
jgi:hypothetical protein